MLATIPMRAFRETKFKTVFVPSGADAPVDSLYVVREWLRSHDFGDVLRLGISDAVSVHEAEGETGGAGKADGVETLSPDAAFEAFLEETVVSRKGGRLTTAQIRTPWAARRGADPEDDIIGGIHKNTIARRFRKRFGAPAGRRGRVNGKTEYYWDDYAIIGGD